MRAGPAGGGQSEHRPNTETATVAGMIARALSAVVFVLLVWVAGAAALPEARNGKLAFASAGDIWVVDPDGEGLESITRGPARDVFPTWSPEGTRIVFSSNRGAAATSGSWTRTAAGYAVHPQPWHPSARQRAHDLAGPRAAGRVRPSFAATRRST